MHGHHAFGSKPEPIEAPYRVDDFPIAPMLFYYEVTQACDLVCKHCRASAQPMPHPEELSTELALALLEQVASFPRKPTVVLTGGDPLKRPDLFDLIQFGTSLGLAMALTPSATPLATREALERAFQAGIRALGISLDGADAATHDAFRGWEGSFERTLRMIRDARELGIPVQVNTTITRRNVDQIDAMAALLASLGIQMWSVFFLVPVGRGTQEERISAAEYEQVFARLWYHARLQPFAVKTTEAPHFRRYVLQHGGHPLHPRPMEKSEVSPASPEKFPRQQDLSFAPVMHRAPLGVTDGKGVMFVSHTGEIYPAGFLPLVCGRFPVDSVVDVYQNHPLFRALRDPDRFRGKCGICEYRYICGGSRARAYAVTGDPLESEPDCIYQPRPGIPPILPEDLTPSGKPAPGPMS
ncbi:MAG: TIGR04053 family radical SAM/SPASM domain-containing protein [Thermoguttaceae bacterium]|nr:TIGR04053 family radical SAM/SPASM domain-containing protein [Thermoguttaceae bacterium]MDW8078134.1 TIGR04053 family radical SAM/SPASM domain-containing protein [Thermoguttaceae bacterium]